MVNAAIVRMFDVSSGACGEGESSGLCSDGVDLESPDPLLYACPQFT